MTYSEDVLSTQTQLSASSMAATLIAMEMGKAKICPLIAPARGYWQNMVYGELVSIYSTSTYSAVPIIPQDNILNVTLRHSPIGVISHMIDLLLNTSKFGKFSRFLSSTDSLQFIRPVSVCVFGGTVMTVILFSPFFLLRQYLIFVIMIMVSLPLDNSVVIPKPSGLPLLRMLSVVITHELQPELPVFVRHIGILPRRHTKCQHLVPMSLPLILT